MPKLLRFQTWLADRTGRQHPRTVYFRPNGEPLAPQMHWSIALFRLVVGTLLILFGTAMIVAALVFGFLFFRALFHLWH